MAKFKVTQKITAEIEAPGPKLAELFFHCGTSHWSGWEVADDADDPVVKEVRTLTE